MLSIGRSGISYQYSLHGYLYKLPKRTYMGVAAPTYIGHDAKQYRLLSSPRRYASVVSW